MCAHSLTEWDERHRAAAANAGPEPASFVRELLPLLPRGPALDLACGTGRHAVLLAERGQPVCAIDGSEVALELLAARARESRVAVRRSESLGPESVSRSGIDLLHADLEGLTLPPGRFALVLCVHYLQRSLFAQIERSLASGGMLLFETFTRAQLEWDGGPKNPDYLLEIGELRTAFPALRL